MRKALLCACLVAFAPAQDRPEAPKPEAAKAAKKKPGLPLKTERKIEFTTDEGTWISLDVSPDGKSIAFELLGDIYTLPIEGGPAKCILCGLAFESQPRYSPDGKWIAFLSDREGSENVWIAKPDGSEPKQLSKEQRAEFASPSWTPDSEYVIASKATGLMPGELFMYHVQGGSGVQITKSAPAPNPPPGTPRLRALGAVASPDGRYIYYARRTGSFGYNVTLPIWQLVRRDRETGDEDVITREVTSAFSPMLSPDGKKLVYATRYETETGLRIRDLATGEERWLKYPVQRDDQESRATRDVYPGYAFTPDGKSLVVFYGGKIHRIEVENGGDALIPFEAKVALDAGPRLYFPDRIDDGPSVKARLIQQPSQSPDGHHLAFSALTHLYKMDLPGGTPARVTAADAREFQPAWSEDGQWLAYVTWSEKGGHIWKVRADGQGAPRQLTRVPAFYRDPVWSADGTRIVALRGAVGARVTAPGDFGIPLDVIWLPAEGGDAQLVVPSRGAGRPHFTSQKDRIFVYSQQGLQSFRFDGTDRRTHIKVVGKALGPEPMPASDVRMHPNGRQALAVVANQIWLVAVPHPGGDPPTVNVSTPSVPVKRLTDIGADYFAWAEDGKTITWAVGSSFFRQPLSTVVFEPEKKPEGDEKKDDKQEEEKPAPKKKPLYEEIDVTVETARARPSGTIVLRGAKVITMKADEVINDAEIVVKDNRIESVGKRGSLSIPSGTKILDLKGTTIMPGIVDVHAHWFEIKRELLDMHAWPYLANLAYGVTSGRDPQTSTNDAFAYQDLVEAGEMLGPRAFSTGPGVFSATDFQSLDDAKNVVSRYRKNYRTNTLKSYMVGNRKQREWMVEACKELKMMPTTEGALDLKLDLTHAIDGFAGNEHALPIVPLYKDVVEVFARSGIFYTPTLLVAYGGPWAENYFYETTEVYNDKKLRRFTPQNVLYSKATRRPWFRKEEHVFPRLAEQAAKIVRAGGHVQIGGHGQIQGIQCHWEMWALASGGLSNHEVLRAATISGAQAIGYAQDLGSIEAGKFADLVVLNKDPLIDIHNTNTIRYVMKNGELFDGDTLNQVWPKQKPLGELWWWNERP